VVRPIDLHIMPDTRGWKVVGSDDPRAIGTADTREDAVSLAAHMQKVNPAVRRIFIHDVDGTVEDRTTLGHRDPFPERKRRPR
jgi:hypothetical protein